MTLKVKKKEEIKLETIGNKLEAALIQGLRFESPRCLLSTEDMYRLPLTSGVGKANLNDIGMAVVIRLDGTKKTSLVKTQNSKRTEEEVADQLRLDIIEHIISLKETARDLEKEAKAKKDKKEKLMSLIAQKQDEVDGAKTLDELKAELDSL